MAEALRVAQDTFDYLPGIEFEIAGFVWQQGWNDMVDEAARKEYTQNLIHLIDDVRREWKKPSLPVVIGELGNLGPDAGQPMKEFRRAQSRVVAHPPFVGNVAVCRNVELCAGQLTSRPMSLMGTIGLATPKATC